MSTRAPLTPQEHLVIDLLVELVIALAIGLVFWWVGIPVWIAVPGYAMTRWVWGLKPAKTEETKR